MLVKCITQEGYLHSPNEVRKGFKQLTTYEEIEEGKSYYVYGIIHFEGGFRYLIYDDHETAYWFPSELFEIVDRTIPDNWHFKFNGQNNDPVSAIFGYQKLMDDDHVEGLAELNQRDMDIFLLEKEKMYK